MKKKFLTVALAATMVVGSTLSALAADVDTSKTYDGGQVIDGAAAWNTADGDNYLISDTPVTVKFVNDPFLRQENGEDKNWFNFVFETVASDSVKGITMRADNFAWTYGDATSEPTYENERSWGDVWDDFMQMCKDNTNVSITATKTNDTTVTFAIAFGSAATETYTITYPDGVPSDLRFHVGADGGKITVNSVTYGAEDQKTDDPKTDDPKTDDPKTDDPKTDDPKKDEPVKSGDVAPIAAFAAVAVVACAAVVVSRKKVTE